MAMRAATTTRVPSMYKPTRDRQSNPSTATSARQHELYALDFVWEFNSVPESMGRTRRPAILDDDRSRELDRALAFAG